MTTPRQNGGPLAPGRKLATIAAVAAFTVTVSGYFMGMLQTGRSAERNRDNGWSQESVHVEEPSQAPTALTYRQLASRKLQPNHGWTSRISDLAPPPAPQDGPRTLSAEEHASAVARRTSRRAYDGAPPTVPHPIDQQHSGSCLSCHGKPTQVGPIRVPQLSHPPYTNCIQCHAPSVGPSSTWSGPPPGFAEPALKNAFTGTGSPGTGKRAYLGAPPVLPHTTWMRQNCLSCHTDGGSSPIKTSHPTRQNCLQCHAPNSTLEQSPLTHPVPRLTVR